MSRDSKSIFNEIIKLEPKRLKGESSSKAGLKYENLASLYIIERFHNISKVKNRILQISFNSIEDIDIFDDVNRIFTFQIKKTKNIWDKSDKRIIYFLERCVDRYNHLKKTNSEEQVKHFFFTNKSGKFLDYWKEMHQKDSSKLLSELPYQIKVKIQTLHLESEIQKIFKNIFFIVGQRKTFLNEFIDKEILKVFESFKEKKKPGEIFENKELNETLYKEKRLKNANIEEPLWKKDILISNTLEIKLNQNKIYVCEKKIKYKQKRLRQELKYSKTTISFIEKRNKIYSFQKFDSDNPLSFFKKEDCIEKEIQFSSLDELEKVELLNDWLFNYLKNINLKYYNLRNKRIFYFFNKNYNKIITWRDPVSKKKKEWKVVQNRGSHYLNVAVEAKIRIFGEKLLVCLNPRYLFTQNGNNLLNSKKINFLERKYRKSFMKNDFLRRWFHMIVSYIKMDEKQRTQTTLLNYEEKVRNLKKESHVLFMDNDLITFEDPIEVITSFMPNNQE